MIEVAVAIEVRAMELVAYQCPPPAVQGPPRPPFWWGNIDMKRTVHVAADAAEIAKSAPKEQTQVKKKRSILCGARTPVWYTKNGRKRYRCK